MATVIDKLHPFAAAKAAGRPPYKVKDLTLAEFGRKEIRLAEQEMPGLMALRSQYGARKPLAGARIMGSLHMTIQTAVLIETLTELIVDDGGDATLVVHKGVEFERAGAVPRFEPEKEPEEWGVILDCIRSSMAADRGRWTRIASSIRGVSEETTTGVHRLYQMMEAG